jgi:hypothetical protein
MAFKYIPPGGTSLFYREGVSIVGKCKAFNAMLYHLVEDHRVLIEFKWEGFIIRQTGLLSGRALVS